MSSTSFSIRLQDEEMGALVILARQEYRDVRLQAAWLVKQELIKLGLLDIEPETTPSVTLKKPTPQ